MFHGSLVALVTPMHEDNTIDYPSLDHLIEWHLENQTDGLVILGTTGESATIEFNERKQIVRLVIDQVANRVPVIVGTGTNCTTKTIELSRYAMDWGADAILVVTPYYNKPTQEGLYQHYKTIADAVPVPQILYNVPSRTGCDLLPETVIRLAECSNIIGLKEATGDLHRVKQLADLEMDLYSGDDATALEFMMQGGRGVISVVANVAPKMMHLMCEAVLNSNFAEASNLDDKLSALYKALFLESNPIPVKWALNEMGLIEKGIRLPLTLLSQKYHDDLRVALKACN